MHAQIEGVSSTQPIGETPDNEEENNPGIYAMPILQT